MKITITDCDFGKGEIEADVLGDDFTVAYHEARSADEVVEAAKGAAGIFVQFANISASVMDELPDLRAIVRYGIGLDNIDLQAAENRGIAVSNVNDYCIDEVAAHAASSIAAASRRLWEYARAIAAGGWGPSIAPSPFPPESDPVGIVGMGRIGGGVAERVRAWGHPVLFWDPLLPTDTQLAGAERVDTLVELASRVNHLSLHVPLLPSTRGLVDAAVLTALGPEGHLVNSSRGALVDEEALLSALNAGSVGRASLDVFVHEPPEPGTTSSELIHHPQVLATPHMAYLSTKALTTLRNNAANRMKEMLS